MFNTDEPPEKEVEKADSPAEASSSSPQNAARLGDGKKAAQCCGCINQMKKDEIVTQLGQLRLNTRGNKETVKKRLKQYWKDRLRAKRDGPPRARPYDRFYDYFCVLDFECTCLEGHHPTYPHEIIEFPIVLLKTCTLEKVDEFHAYCKPVKNPVLSDFCKWFTGISQENVDSAKTFPGVLKDVEAWLAKHQLGTTYAYAFVADGPWDLGKFMQLQCGITGIPIPHEFRYWVNLRKLFTYFYHIERLTIAKMLQSLGLTFEGREHSGLDDARNLARIAVQMMQNGAELRVNQRIMRRDKVAAKPAKNNTDSNVKAEERLPPFEDETLEQKLPYKILPVSKFEFLADTFDECLTCSEEESE